MPKLRVAIIGQSVFGAEVYKRIRDDGHQIVGVFTICDDKQGRADVLAQAAEADGIKPRELLPALNSRVHCHGRFRTIAHCQCLATLTTVDRTGKIARWKALKKDGGLAIPEVLNDYKSVGADLNVLAFVSQFIPMEVIDAPAHGSIVYHPSLLPRHRGASAINWTLMEGDETGGFTIFFADDGLDTGPVLLTRETPIEPDDTVNSLYERFMFPEGIAAMGEAVGMIASGEYPRRPQPEEGATYDPIWQKKECAKIDWGRMHTASELHNFIRGNDRVPGAWCVVGDEQVTLLGSTVTELEAEAFPVAVEDVDGEMLKVEDCALRVLVTDDGIAFDFAKEGKRVLASKFQVGRRVLPGSQFFDRETAAVEMLELTEAETSFASVIKGVWAAILCVAVSAIEPESDFFDFGAGSMDVVRLIEETKQR